MTLKRVIIISIFAIFLISFVTHNVYSWLPNFFTSIFFPVNESIWEHQKMIFTAYLIWWPIEYFLLKKNNLPYNNIIFGLIASALFNMSILIIIYLPIYIIYGHNLTVTLIVYFITIILSQYLNYSILESNCYYPNLNLISLVAIPIILIIFGILTYYPLPYKPLFSESNSRYMVTKYPIKI